MSAGRFVWRELVVASPAASFYASLFGWSTKSVPMGDMTYTLFRHATLDEDVGGSVAPQMKDVPPFWLDYITVDDLDRAAATIARLGGKVLSPTIDAPGVGRFFIAADPAGAVFAPFLSATPGATPDRNPPVGTFCWSQLMTSNLDRSVPFYCEVFGWTPMPTGPMTVFAQGEHQRASAAPYPDAPMPDMWLKYVAVSNCDASWESALKLGAAPIKAPTDIPGLGRFAVLADPTGAVFALWTHTGSM
jgi:predicted enzyme related to lactoylglutathione lyase